MQCPPHLKSGTLSEEAYFVDQRSPPIAAWQEDFLTQSGGLLRRAINESVVKVGLITTVCEVQAIN